MPVLQQLFIHSNSSVLLKLIRFKVFAMKKSVSLALTSPVSLFSELGSMKMLFGHNHQQLTRALSVCCDYVYSFLIFRIDSPLNVSTRDFQEKKVELHKPNFQKVAICFNGLEGERTEQSHYEKKPKTSKTLFRDTCCGTQKNKQSEILCHYIDG